jgi:exonuclease III
MLLVSWNVAGRVKRLEEQAQRLLSLDADAVCLQEITKSTLPRWRQLLQEAGYRVEHGDLDSERSRLLAVLTACRAPIEPAAVDGVPWPERVLAVRMADDTEIVNVHSPISPKPDLAKVRTHEAVHRHLAGNTADHPRILCGDLNTPRKEHRDGSVWTFARDQYGRLRTDRGERWEEAELALIRGLGPSGFRDAFRLKHGFEVRELSWEWPRWKGGYRLDHLLVSAGIEVIDCHYEHHWRQDGLSDHSALVARLVRRA